MSQSSSDFICKLPDDLKAKILEYLPLSRAVKTSVLSRNWRHVWTRMQRLEFSCDHEYISLHEIIDRVLSLQQGYLEQFTVFIPARLRSGFTLLSCFFLCLASKRIQVIEIFGPDTAAKRKDIYIPSSLFECRGLRRLLLWQCDLSLPQNFQCLNNLVTLELGYISSSSTSKQLAEVISHCPNLEKLYLHDAIFDKPEPLILSAYNLKKFYLADRLASKIIFKDTPCLTSVTLRYPDYDLDSMPVKDKKLHTMFQLLCSMSAVEELSFDLLLRDPLDGDCPIKLRKELVALKTLHMDELNICSRDDVLFTLCLLRSSPNLKTLSIYLKDIKLNRGDDEAYVEWLEVERGREYSFIHLENVKIENLLGLRGLD